MFIEDEELRTLYRDASKDHLDKLEAGFLHLEKNPDDLENLKGLLRATHSLKGDSRMLGVQDAETLTHQLEDLLSSVEKGARAITPALCDCLYQGLDAVRKIAHEAITGEASNVSVFHVMAQLIDAGETAEETFNDAAAEERAMMEWCPTEPSPLQHDHDESVAVVTPPPAEEDYTLNTVADFEPEDENLAGMKFDLGQTVPSSQDSAELTEPPQPSQPEMASNEVYHIDTIRVEAPRLDILVTQAGELAVTKRRITRRMDDIDKILLFWEDWVRTNFANRLMLAESDSQITPETLASIQTFQQQTEDRLDQLGELLKYLRTSSYEDSAQLETLSNDLESGILKLRQVPISKMFSVFPRMVRDLGRHQSKNIDLVIEGGDTQADKRILEEMKAPLSHLIRNAIDHGIETPSERLAMGKTFAATIRLKAYQQDNHTVIEVSDDGRGLSLEKIKRTAVRRGLYAEEEIDELSSEQLQELIFVPGFSTRRTITEISGRGVGLDVVRTNVERLKGTIGVKSEPAKGCTFKFTFNTSLATAAALLVTIDETPYAIPIEFVDMIMRVEHSDIFTLEGNPTVAFQGKPLSVAWLTDLLGLPTSVVTHSKHDATPSSISCIVLKVGLEQFGIFVDALVDQQNIVFKPHSKLLKHVHNIAGATILGTGEVCMVLSPQDLIESLRGKRSKLMVPILDNAITPPRILLVEDSIPIRTQVRRILEGAGYEVTTAVDGLDGFNKLHENNIFDAVVSDVEMPNLSGLELTSRIRQESNYDELPIILVTTLAKEEDKHRGADAGANAYITKGDFDQSLLLTTLRDLI
ncbi:MAG: hybrid sensor histidine kinase/response regulator [Cyanobacteria bacterium P01_F01_bin.116]